MDSPNPSDPAFSGAMRELTRAHVAQIWKDGKSGVAQSVDDAEYYQLMLQHPEYRDIWETAAELVDREVTVDGVNPFLHIAMHSVIERQIADRKPPEADQALFRLMRAGMDRHEATHHIARTFSDLLWGVLREKKQFDNAIYRRRLRALKP